MRRVAEVMDGLAVRHGLSPATVSFPDAGTVMELLEEAGFLRREDAVRTVAQRRAFDRGSLVGFVRTQAALAYTGDATPEAADAFITDVDADHPFADAITWAAHHDITHGYPDGTDPAPMEGIVDLTAGAQHSCAVLDDGSLRCWGANLFGTLLRGPVKSSVPVPVLAP